jgi:quinohemoprotein amine dehydrogenase
VYLKRALSLPDTVGEHTPTLGRRMNRMLAASCLALWSLSALPHAQPAPARRGDAVVSDEGIPIDNPLVRSRCGGCHRTDDKGRMTRISFRRASPENWELTIRRMVTLNNVKVSPEEARAIAKYLSDHNGLAPEEQRPIAFESERRLVDFPYTADETTSNLCSSCHSIARVLSERRTTQEWELLIAMHRSLYPLVDTQPMNGGSGFMRSGGRGGGRGGGRAGGRGDTAQELGPDGRPLDDRHPVDRALEHLEKTLPLMSSDWSAWSAAMQSPKLAGRWAVSGSQLGKGPIFGEVTIAADPSTPDTFTTDIRYTVPRTGETVTRSGKAIVYTGYQWRGRANDWREVMFVERDWKQMWGRWFTGPYDETGVDIRLTRVSSDPVVLGASVTALKTGATGQNVRIFGTNLPTSIRPEDIGLGQGVTVTRIAAARPDELSIDVDIAASAPIGRRDVSITGTVKPAILVVYDKVDGIRVLPQSGMARVGGAAFPKQLQQFQAVGLNNGPDGKPDTADDLDLGIVDVKWSLEEYSATFNDDDLQYVGTLDQNGLFTPGLDGPNPKRSGNRNNIGDVWVVADTTSSPRVRARAHLLVTVPLYMNWFAQESK